MKKKIIAAAAVLVMLFAFVIPIFALTTTVTDFDTTPVLQDLQGAKIEDKLFNITDYPTDSDGELRVLALLEFGYHIIPDKEAGVPDGGLYVYIYNPQQIVFDVNSAKNKISIGSYSTVDKYGNPANYYKYDLKYISKSPDELFYKFKVMAYNYDFERKYSVSEVELYSDGANATSYDVARRWTYTGYDMGFAAQAQTQSTKACLVDNIDTIEFNLKSTTFRTPNSAKGEHYQQDVHTVWFTVPKSFLNNYGELVAIQAEWYEYQTNPIVVTENTAVYEAVNAVKSVHFTDKHQSSYLVITPYPYFWVPPVQVVSFSINGYDSTINYTYASDKHYSHIGDVVFVEDINVTVTKEQLKHNFEGDIIANNFLSSISDSGRQVGYNRKIITTDDTFELKSFTAALKWYQKIGNEIYGYTNGIDATVLPIVVMTDNIWRNMADNYIGENERAALHSDYMKALVSDSVVILFRFAVTDYYAEYVSVGNPELTTTSAKDTYVAVMTVFKDFDILALTFRDDYGETVIPVTTSPINIIPDVTSPIEKEWLPNVDKDGLLNMIIRILQLVLLLLVLMLFWQPLLVVGKMIIGIIKAPFKLKRRRKK